MMKFVHSHRPFMVGLVLAAVTVVALGGTPAEAARFGAGCQRKYQRNWQTTIHYAWQRCGGFVTRLRATDQWVFYHNLKGAKWWWEMGGDQFTLDNVDLFYACTHGGTNANDSLWAMWNRGSLAYSSNMRLGDEAYGLSILATYSCGTLKYDDGGLWTRMGPIMRGGLRIAAGSHDCFYDSWMTAGSGASFARYLQTGRTIRRAWKLANYGWWTDNAPAVMATGTSAASCRYRRDRMTWQNFSSYPRLQDSQITWYCYVAWW